VRSAVALLLSFFFHQGEQQALREDDAVGRFEVLHHAVGVDAQAGDDAGEDVEDVSEDVSELETGKEEKGPDRDSIKDEIFKEPLVKDALKIFEGSLVKIKTLKGKEK